jgi:type VI secretion system secreted protein Hcp
MPTPAYMWMKDNSGNSVDGSVEVAGREKSVEVLEFEHEVRIPTDPDTGKLTGTRKHESIRLLKAIDASSPYLYKAVCEGQTFSEVLIRWYRINDAGVETEYFCHQLKDVRICSVRPIMYNVKDSSKEKFEHMEEVQLRYEDIVWTYADGNLQTSDSWGDRT